MAKQRAHADGPPEWEVRIHPEPALKVRAWAADEAVRAYMEKLCIHETAPENVTRCEKVEE